MQQQYGRRKPVMQVHRQAALIVSNGQSQEGAHHAAAISDGAVEQESWVGNLHLLIVRVDVVHQGIH